MTLQTDRHGNARSGATRTPWRRLKDTVRHRFPRLWRTLKSTKVRVTGDLLRFLQKRLIRKEVTIYLGENDQDKWVIEDVFNKMRNRYFLELGAYNGFDISTTYILEKRYGWRGICIEPDPVNFARLVKERNCICVQACVDGVNREVTYLYDGAVGGIIDRETDIKPDSASQVIELAREDGRLAAVETKTLSQILRENDAPRIIDFFSFDVEGAETRILRDFEFGEYIFRALVIERASEELNEILFRNGYKFVQLRVGDSFYVHESLPNLESLPREPFRQVPPKPAPLEINYRKKPMTLRLALRALF